VLPPSERALRLGKPFENFIQQIPKKNDERKKQLRKRIAKSAATPYIKPGYVLHINNLDFY
jgi:hypothetical protein